MGDVFQFLSSASLEKLTGRRAHNLGDLLNLLKSCPDSSIFHHTFSTFRKMREVQVPYNNDFAIWISSKLHEEALAEKFMAIDLMEFSDIGSIRKRLIDIIQEHTRQFPMSFHKPADEPFYLWDSVHIVYLTDKFAYNLKSFREILETVSVDSLYFHFIESRLHTRQPTDDFSRWMEESLGLSELARNIRKIDISIYTLQGLRKRIAREVDAYLEKSAA